VNQHQFVFFAFNPTWILSFVAEFLVAKFASFSSKTKRANFIGFYFVAGLPDAQTSRNGPNP
jgi:hypothetical protein